MDQDAACNEGINLGDVVLDERPVPSLKWAQPPPVFGPCLFWPNGRIDEYATFGTEIHLGPGHIVLNGNPAPPRKGHISPLFWSMSIVATVAHLSYC